MALARWSYSDHYIYETGDDELCVQFMGHFDSKYILNNYDEIENRAKEDGCGVYSRWELKQYLTTWAKIQIGTIDTEEGWNHIDSLRLLGYIKTYIQNPYSNCFQYALMGMYDLWDRNVTAKLFPVYHSRREEISRAEAKRWLEERKKNK